MIYGKFPDFENKKSIKLKKNINFVLFSASTLENDGSTDITITYYLQAKNKNFNLFDDTTLTFDGSDTKYYYYHIPKNSSNYNNPLLIIPIF